MYENVSTCGRAGSTTSNLVNCAMLSLLIDFCYDFVRFHAICCTIRYCINDCFIIISITTLTLMVYPQNINISG